MPDNKQVYRTKRIKTKNGLKNALLHNTRQLSSINEYIYNSRSKYNIYRGANNAVELWSIYEERMKLITSKRKKQKNASFGIEEVHGFSHDFCKDWLTDENAKNTIFKYFQDLLTAIKSYKNRKYTILSYSVHMDESTPHIHILYIPLVYKDDICKFSSSDFIGNRENLRKIQNYIYENVGKPYGFMERTVGSRTKNVPLTEYKNKMNKEEDEITKNKAILDNLINSNRNINKKLLNDELIMKEKEKKIIKREQDIMKKHVQISNMHKKYKDIDISTKVEIPVIPVPPFEPFEEKRKKFVDFWQSKFFSVISGLILQIKSLLIKNDELSKSNDHLINENKKLKRRALKAETDLNGMPINEIISLRENRNISEKENDKINQHDKSRK